METLRVSGASTCLSCMRSSRNTRSFSFLKSPNSTLSFFKTNPNIKLIKKKCLISISCTAVDTKSSLPEELELAKSDLMEYISYVKGRGKGASDKIQKGIAEAIYALEKNGGMKDPVESDLIEGKWRLMYTTRPGTASPIQRTFVGVDSFSVFQEIVLRNTTDPRVTNIVNFSEDIGELKVEACASVGGGKRIDFRFDRAAFDLKFWPYRFPYPVPFRLLGDEAKGWLDTTFLSPSGDLRISRGNKGTVFVLQKFLNPRQKLFAAIKSNRNVLQAIDEMVQLNPTPSPAKSKLIFGKWKLIWTSQASDASYIQKVSVGISNNWQIIREKPERLENVVEFLPGVLLRAGARTEIVSDVQTDVYIDSAAVEIGSFRLPLGIKGEGYVEQMFLDDKLRISKGNKGSIFVHVRDD